MSPAEHMHDSLVISFHHHHLIISSSHHPDIVSSAARRLQKMNHATGCVDVDAEMLDDEILSAENFSAQSSRNTPENAAVLGDKMLSVDSDPHTVPRSELMYLFFNAPVTLFMVDAMQQVPYPRPLDP
eukprot:3935869-Rhodomonas_salina.4